MKCNVCFHHCNLEEGQYGFCGVRTCADGLIRPDNYGKITSIALDPIEKKPLNNFCPGSMILSVGSFGCNLRCPFCQNYEISYDPTAYGYSRNAKYIGPMELAEIAASYKDAGNIGVAFTYNEPLIGYEYVRDTAKIVKEMGMKTVLVSNGTASVEVLDEILPYIDAMNIDIKAFSDRFYDELVGGNRKMVMDFVEKAAKSAHVEVTTLIIPWENDDPDEIKALSKWLSSISPEHDADGKGSIPLHITRFFPRYRMTGRDATEISSILDLCSVAEKNLTYVYAGNI